MLVQRTVLSILTQHWNDNISESLQSDYKISCFVFVANANCSHTNIYSYHDPLTGHAPLSPLGSPAQIIRSVIPPKSA